MCDKYAASTGNVRERKGGASEREFQLVDLVVERQPVMGREAVLADRQPMLARRIALVLRPAVLGKLFGDAEHVLVTMGFGKHRSRGNVGVFAIALDDAAPGNFETCAEPVAVDGQKRRNGIEARHSQRHALERSVQDVDFVDPRGGDRLDSPCDGLALDDGPQLFAVALAHLLRVVEQRVVEIGRQHHGP